MNYYGDDGTPSICQISLIFGDAGSLATTGYIVKKGKHYSTHMANDHSAGTSEVLFPWCGSYAYLYGSFIREEWNC